MIQKVHKYFILFLLVLFSATLILAEGGNKQSQGSALQKTSDDYPTVTLFNVNDISTWIYNNGNSDIDNKTNAGFEFPKGSGNMAIFETGFIWGGKVGDEIRVGGSTYNQGLQSGAIKSDGTPEDQSESRIYRVRNDWKTCDLNNDITKLGYSEDRLRSIYEADWNDWPASKGAPYEDVDGNGSYDPAVDIPGVPGADQTIWFVANDLNPTLTDALYGSAPFGVELQATFWGYNTTDALGKMMFRKYMLINKTDVIGSPVDFTDMYVSIWSDPDLGGANDDFSGVDVDLSLAYTYNGTASDEAYGAYSPAVGFDFFQGPMIPGEPSDTAIFDLKKRGGFKNMPATAHYFFIKGDQTYDDPELGIYQGSLEFYNLLRGRVGKTGDKFKGPAPYDDTTSFALWGNPVTQSGWVDGLLHNAGDRRSGMASGPFSMAPGDTQDIVVAEIAAGSFAPVDRLSAVGLLKFYDESAQIAYDNLFEVPKPPAKPIVSVSELENEIILSWYGDKERVAEIENFDQLGFKFEGYCIYQFPYKGATADEAILLATVDLNNGIGKVIDKRFDTKDGVVYNKVVKFGSDSGIKRYISIKSDASKSGAPLLNGSEYYFAVTAYAVHSNANNIPRVLENPLEVFTVVPQSNKPGTVLPTEIGDEVVVDHEGTANANVEVKVVEPTELTGDNYEVYFEEHSYYLDVDGKWKPVAAKGAHKDVSGSYLDAVAITSETAGTVDLVFTLTIDSPNGAYVDGVVIKFPDGIKINSAEEAETGGQNSHVTPTIDGQTVTWGHNNLTEYGDFAGGEELHMNIDIASVPFDFEYTIYDDGYEGADIIDAQGTGTVAKIGYAQKTVPEWFLKNTTTGKVLLSNQPETNVDEQTFAASPVIEGFQIRVNGNFGAPINFDSIELVENPSGETTLSSDASATTTNIDIANYTIFGGTISSWAYDNFGDSGPVGTTSVDALQQDYELRFTGVEEENIVNGQVQVTTVSGGSMATCFRFGEGLAAHPLNPTGEDKAFLIRIPFEVWNVEDPNNEYQVNLTFRDRMQVSTDPLFYAWNKVDRMYAIIVNTPYDETQPIQIDDGPDDLNANATWVTVHYGTNYHLGDVVRINYANPIQFGKDKFTFKTEAPTFDSEKESADLEKINVFPNPYYGVNPQELNKYNRWVTFSHLPAKAEITIVNLGGQIVRKLNKEDETQFLKWDLANENGLPVASGLYLAYVDMPDQGKTKILKVAIFQEQQVLDRF